MLPGPICGEYSLTVSPAPLPRSRVQADGGKATEGASLPKPQQAATSLHADPLDLPLQFDA
jgi:hypothetical protein